MTFPFREFDPACLTRLNDLAVAADAEVVVSSSWRKADRPEESTEELAATFDEVCVHWSVDRSIAGRISDVTPFLNTDRGFEIERYLARRGSEVPYVILDDQGDFLPGQPLVQTNARVGLAYADCVRALEFLAQIPGEQIE